MTNTETMRPKVWAVVVWKLQHGTFVALRTVDETIAPVDCRLTTSQTPGQAADTVTQNSMGVTVSGWTELPARAGLHLMVSTVTEAPIDLGSEANWIDVDQLPLLSAFTPGFDLVTLYLALQQL